MPQVLEKKAHKIKGIILDHYGMVIQTKKGKNAEQNNSLSFFNCHMGHYYVYTYIHTYVHITEQNLLL